MRTPSKAYNQGKDGYKNYTAEGRRLKGTRT